MLFRSLLPGGISPWIANFTAKEVPPSANGDATCVKLKTRLNLHGVMSFEGAYVEEVEEKEEAMDVDPPAEGAAPPKKKRIVRKKEIPFVATNTSLDKSVVEALREQENQMHAADKLVYDTEVSIDFFSSFWFAYINLLFRIVKTLSRSMYMTREASSMSVTLRTFNLRKNPSS